MLSWDRRGGRVPGATWQPEGCQDRLADPIPHLSLNHRDPAYFRPFSAATASNQKALAENWVLRFNNLKRLYKLLIRYFEYVLEFGHPWRLY